jgi:hypothetical protein
LNSALLTGLKFFAITWTISTPGLKCYKPGVEMLYVPGICNSHAEVKKREILKDGCRKYEMYRNTYFFPIWGVNNLDITV